MLIDGSVRGVHERGNTITERVLEIRCTYHSRIFFSRVFSWQRRCLQAKKISSNRPRGTLASVYGAGKAEAASCSTLPFGCAREAPSKNGQASPRLFRQTKVSSCYETSRRVSRTMCTSSRGRPLELPRHSTSSPRSTDPHVSACSRLCIRVCKEQLFYNSALRYA